MAPRVSLPPRPAPLREQRAQGPYRPTPLACVATRVQLQQPSYEVQSIRARTLHASRAPCRRDDRMVPWLA